MQLVSANGFMNRLLVPIGLTPRKLPGAVPGRVRDRRRTTIVGAQRDNGGRDFGSDCDAARLGIVGRDRGDEVVVRCLVLRRAIREQTLEHAVSRRSRGRFLRRTRCRRRRRGTECFVRADDGVNCVIDGNVNRGEIDRNGGRCSSAVPVAAGATLIVSVAILFQ